MTGGRMALRNRQQRNQLQQQQNDQQERRKSQVGFALGPMLATVDGDPVTIIAYQDDVPGHSPAFLCVDTNNDSEWVSKDDQGLKIFPVAINLTTDILTQLQGGRGQNAGATR